MLPLRALRSSSLRAAAKVPLNRGYATTVAEEAAEIQASLFDKKVEISVVEKGKGYYINYKRIEDNLKIVRER